jgi:hypothetical protein
MGRPGDSLTRANAHIVQGPEGFYSIHSPGTGIVALLPIAVSDLLGSSSDVPFVKSFLILLSGLVVLAVWKLALVYVRSTGGRVLAVLKADAYGHGAVACACALVEADGFALAFGNEATALRAAGIRVPLLVLEGVFSVGELHTAVHESWWIVVHHEEQLAMIEQCPVQPGGLNVWLKLDSGMHRCGFEPHAFRAAHARLMATARWRRSH